MFVYAYITVYSRLTSTWQACSQRGGGARARAYPQWFVPHGLARPWAPFALLAPLPILIHDLGVGYLTLIRVSVIWHKIAQNHENLLKFARFRAKIATCIHYEFFRNGFIVNDIFYTGPHCQIKLLYAPSPAIFWQHAYRRL